MAEPRKAAEKAGSLTDAVPTDALKDAGQALLGLLVQRAAQAATERVTGLSDRLSGVAENGGAGLTSALRGRDSDDSDDDSDDEDSDDGDSGGGGGILGNLKDKIKGAFGGGGSGAKKLKVTQIVEDMDVGVPLRTAYDLWTRYEDFPSFMKKVESVNRESDEKTHWKAQVLWSHREWDATVVEQVPDSHIVWRSKGAKGHVDGAVSFTEAGPNMTRILLVLEYWPQGLFERTGNLWRAQGRRARLEFQHFRRHAMTNVLLHPEDVEGWRGEIRDGEVVQTHEEAVEEEQRAEESEGTADEAADDEAADDDREADEPRAADDEAEDEYDDETDEYDDDADDVDAAEEDDVAGDTAVDDDDDYDDETDEDAPADEEATNGSGRSRRREPAGARSRRGR